MQGRYTLAYFDFVADPRSPTGAYLYLTNDWITDTDEEDGGAIPDGCYNRFDATAAAPGVMVDACVPILAISLFIFSYSRWR